jgi:hypothetical protein
MNLNREKADNNRDKQLVIFGHIKEIYVGAGNQ